MSLRVNLGMIIAVAMTTAAATASCSGKGSSTGRSATSVVSVAPKAGEATPLQVQYEGLHNAVDPVIDQVRVQLSHLPAGATSAALTPIVDPLIMKLTRFNSHVLTLPWSAEQLPGANTVAADGTALANDLIALGRTTAAAENALVAKALADDAKFDASLLKFTQALHLPVGE